MENITHFTENDFHDKSLNNFTGYVLMYTDWCKYCKDLKPVWKALHNMYPHGVASINCTTDNKGLIKKYSISGFPSILIFKDGKFQGMYESSRELETLSQNLKAVLALKSNVDNTAFKTGTSLTGTFLQKMLYFLLILLFALIFLSLLYLIYTAFKEECTKCKRV